MPRSITPSRFYGQHDQGVGPLPPKKGYQGAQTDILDAAVARTWEGFCEIAHRATRSTCTGQRPNATWGRLRGPRGTPGPAKTLHRAPPQCNMRTVIRDRRGTRSRCGLLATAWLPQPVRESNPRPSTSPAPRPLSHKTGHGGFLVALRVRDTL